MPQTIVILGASRGIGLEMARQAKARGDDVIASARSADGVAALSDHARVIQCDVTDDTALKAAADNIGAKVDLLVVNAGLYRGRGGMDADDMGPEAMAAVLMTNVAGPFLAVRAFLPTLADQAKIAIISSVMGSSEGAAGNGYIYRASKAGATNVAMNFAQELKPAGIAVGAYHPGWVRTDMGGPAAAISPEESASGLLSRFDHLSMATTGVFEDYKGDAIPF